MKKFIIVLLAFCASSCAVQWYNEQQYLVDFRPYTEEGFIISPLSTYAAEYNPIGIVSMEFTPGFDKPQIKVEEPGAKKKEGINDDLYFSGERHTSSKKHKHTPTWAEMMDKFVDYAKSLGANGILDYHFERDRASGKCCISGFAVYINR